MQAEISPLVTVPKIGVVSVGLVAKHNNPDPVSFEITPASSAEVVAANCANVPDVTASPPPRVVSASGRVYVLVVAVVSPDNSKTAILVLSAESLMNRALSNTLIVGVVRVLFVIV